MGLFHPRRSREGDDLKLGRSTTINDIQDTTLNLLTSLPYPTVERIKERLFYNRIGTRLSSTRFCSSLGQISQTYSVDATPPSQDATAPNDPCQASPIAIPPSIPSADRIVACLRLRRDGNQSENTSNHTRECPFHLIAVPADLAGLGGGATGGVVVGGCYLPRLGGRWTVSGSGSEGV